MSKGVHGKRANASSEAPSETPTFAKEMTLCELLVVLRPYFWPNEGSDGALKNRVRASCTWLCVIFSKGSSLCAPYYLQDATNHLLENHWDAATKAIFGFAGLKVLSSLLKEMQGVLYVKVKQQATIELQAYTFRHLHNLSLGWHLNKKTGTVMKSMDRGVDAANTLVNYMFLYLVRTKLAPQICLSPV